MRTSFFVAAITMALFGAQAFAQENFDRTELVQQGAQASIEEYIRPAFAAFEDTAKLASSEVGELCSTPSAEALNVARSEFSRLAAAWSRVEFLRFGPLAQNNRFERLHFWPDRRGRALRQVQGALGTEDPSVTTSASIAGKSVAVQGLSALEYLLFGTGSDALTSEGAGHRCAFAAAVSENIANIAAELEADWRDPEGFASAMLEPGSDNDDFRNAREVAVQMFVIAVDGLAWVKDVKLRPALGDEPAKAKPKRAIFWRSGGSFASIAGNLEGLETYLETTQLLALLPEEEARFADSIRFEFGNARRTLANIEADPLTAYAQDPDRSRLSYLLIVTESLSMLMEGRVGPSLGIEAGFSVLDGD